MGDSKSTLDEDDDDVMAADTKLEADPDGSPYSVESASDQDAHAESTNQEPAPPQKRKGGRKPIYATSEERKQRNRQAQAAFRERRTEYIKQLEATIKSNEETLSTLQQNHRTAADECLMLRYKNSLLERILLEKGVDVQAELQIKAGSPLIGTPLSLTGNVVPQQQSQTLLQRTAVQRQHARRSGGQQFLPKLAPGHSLAEPSFSTSSPQGVPTPSSHASSPTNAPVRSPMSMQQGVMTPPASTVLGQTPHSMASYQRAAQIPQNGALFASPQQSPNIQRRPAGPVHHQSTASVHSSHSTGSQYSMNPSAVPVAVNNTNINQGRSSASVYYPSPFQKHIDRLEQEYDIEHSSMLEQESETLPDHDQRHFSTRYDSAPRHENRGYYQQALSTGMSGMQPQGQLTAMPQNVGHAGLDESFHHMDQSIDPTDPMLDADPFGLSASMHYPTSYSSVHEHPQQS